jgi:hypothetical protein
MFQTNQPVWFGVDHRVLAPSVRQLVGGEHHHRRIEGQVLPLAVGREIVPPPSLTVDSQPIGRGTVQLLNGEKGSGQASDRGS